MNPQKIDASQIAGMYAQAMHEHNLPPNAPLRFTQAKADYYSNRFHMVAVSEGKLWFLGHEIIIDNRAPEVRIGDIVKYSARKYRESQASTVFVDVEYRNCHVRGGVLKYTLKATRHPWDLAYVYASGEVFERFDATTALSAHHFSARNIRLDGTLRPIPESEPRANVLAYADQTNRENIHLRAELERTERRVKALEEEVLIYSRHMEYLDVKLKTILAALQKDST